MKSRAVAFAVLVVAVAVAVVVPAPLAVAALVLPVAAVLVGARLRLDRIGQAAFTVVPALLGVLAARVLSDGAPSYDVTALSERRIMLALPVLTVAAARALIERPRWGAAATLLAALIALTAAGGALTGWVYPTLVVGFAALALIALRAADRHRAPVRQVTGKVTLTLAVAIAASTVLVGASTLLLPELHRALVARMAERLRSPHAGFSDELVLGSLRGLLADDRVVLRVRGERPPGLLRGAVFTEYGGNRWLAPERLPPQEIAEVVSTRPAGSEWIEIENASQPERYFLPLDAEEVATSSGFLGRDLLGVHYPVPGAIAKRVWFRRAGRLRMLEPGPVDLAVPRKFVGTLLRLVQTWNLRDGAALQRLRRIESGLRHQYRYSLTVERPLDRDPLLDFFQLQRAGHCEYFASAMAMLARAVGVPTRVVSGYRVVERSPFGYTIVRRRHAHTWVESWVDGRWITLDPTPAVDLGASSPSQTPLLAAVADAAATGWEAADDWLQRRTAFEFSLALVMLASGLVLARALRVRRVRTRRRSARDLPLPAFTALDRKLTRLGIERSPTETLARFADRVERSSSLSEARRQEVAVLIRDYALLRYAGRGDSGAVQQRLAQVARTL